MDWKGRRQSSNVEDRRGGGRAARGGAVGIGGVVLLVLYLVLGGDPEVALQAVESGAISNSSNSSSAPAGSGVDDESRAFISTVLADTEDAWGAIFTAAGQRYQPAKLVLFTGAVDSACGYTSAAVGPFYCPGDRQVYIDLSFYDDLARSYGAPGDFAQAYVLAHEVGHHIQTLTGVSRQVSDARRRASEAEANQLSVMQELQADCYAGVWGHRASKTGLLEAGDLEEGLRAAAAIGDDRLQKQSQGYVVPESFTHGSSEQRVRWFSEGLKYGDMERCDTFSASSL